MKKLRSLYRFLGFISWTCLYLFRAILISPFFPKNTDFFTRELSKWGRHMLRFLRIEVEREGNIPEHHCLIVPNHRSYIDIPIVAASFLCVFVPKIEIKKWPIIGYGATLVRSIFVDRSDKESRKKTRESIRARLEEGMNVIVFAEGTTTKAPDMKPLKPGTFVIAADGDIPILPLAIEYEDPDDAWVGDDTFVPHFFEAFSKRRTKVKMRVGPVMRGEDAEGLRAGTEEWLRGSLEEMRGEIWEDV